MQRKKSSRPTPLIGATPLKDLLNAEHPLYRLAAVIYWQTFEEVEFGKLYAEGVGRPALPTRLLAGLHYLKHLYNLSDEVVVASWVENPYWQYFCGETYFRHRFPCDPSSLVRWRRRVGPEGIEKLLKETLQAAQREQAPEADGVQARQCRHDGAGESHRLPDRCPTLSQGPEGARCGWRGN